MPVLFLMQVTLYIGLNFIEVFFMYDRIFLVVENIMSLLKIVKESSEVYL